MLFRHRLRRVRYLTTTEVAAILCKEEREARERAAAVAATTAIPKCAIEGCRNESVCLLAVKGEWHPICHEHSVNRMLPRRNFVTTPP